MPNFSFLRENTPWLTAGVLLTFLSSFGQTFVISVFSGEIRAEFGLSHSAWGGIYTLGTTVSAIVMVWAGGLTDSHRTRVLGSAVLVGLASACLFMALNPVAWLLPVVIFALRFAGQGMTSHIAVVSISRWFVATRGKALSVASLGFSLGEALLPVLFVALMLVIDWHIIWILSAVAVLSGIPVLRLLLRTERTPQSLAKEDHSLGMDKRNWTRNETLRHWLFWLMVPALLGPSAFNTAFFFQQVHYAGVKGWDHIDLVALFPFYTLSVVVSLVFSGWALDKFGTPRVLPWFLVPTAIGFVLFAQAQSLGVAFIGLMFMALTNGMNATVPNAFWAEFYGTRNLGSIKAMATAVMVLGSAIGPGVTGYLIDAGVGIETQYFWVAVYFICASLMMAFGIAKARRRLSS